MNRRSITVTALFGLILTCIPTNTIHAYYHDDTRSSSNIFTWMGVGAAVAAGIGLVTWACTPSDETVLNDAQKVTDAIAWSHDPFINNPNGILYSAFISSDDGLYSVAQRFFRAANNAVTTTTATIKNDIKTLVYHIDRVNGRLGSDSRRKDAFLYQRMQEVIARMRSVQQQLESILNYLQAHSAYFNLYRNEDMLMDLYRPELNIIAAQYYTYYDMQERLRVQIITDNQNKHHGLALKQFVSALANNIKYLNELIYKAAYQYPNRASAATALASNLTYIQQAVLGHPGYQAALAEYEMYRQQQERIHLEQERIRLEKERMDQEYWANRRQENLLREQNQLLREQATKPIVVVC